MRKRKIGPDDKRHQNQGRPPGKDFPVKKLIRVTHQGAARLAHLAETQGISEAAVIREALDVAWSERDPHGLMSEMYAGDRSSPDFFFASRCERCGHEWVPRQKDEEPRVCPKCKSPYWDTARKSACAKTPATLGRTPESKQV